MKENILPASLNGNIAIVTGGTRGYGGGIRIAPFEKQTDETIEAIVRLNLTGQPRVQQIEPM